jgi:hypothetical protein
MSVKTYLVMLEGNDDSGHYFITFETISTDPEAASALSLAEGRNLGLSIVGVEDVEVKHVVPVFSKQCVVSISGKSYFEEAAE